MNLIGLHLCDFRNLVPIVVKHGNAQGQAQIVFSVVPDIGFGPFGLQYSIALFPDTERMRLDA